MSEFMFGVRTSGQAIPARDVKRIDKIADAHGCCFVQIREATREWKAWFAGPNRGDPFDRAMATQVMNDVETAGLGEYFDRGGSQR